jgi:glycosyltransferase involved in cell wall biosynthesis
MRIVAITDKPDRPETALIRGLADREHEISLVSALPQTSLPGELSSVRHVHHRIPGRISRSTIQLIRELAKEADIVHCFTGRAVSNAVLAIKGSTPKIIAYRGTVGHLSKLDPTSWISFLNPKVAAISCVSHAVERYLLGQGVKPERLFAIYKGHDPAWYEAARTTNVEQTRSDIGVPSGAPIVCFVGNMRPVKGADLLIDAFSATSLSGGEQPAHLVLVGDIRDSAVRRAVERSKHAFNIHLLGSRTDAAAIVAASDIFVMPSREREGLPKAVIEAMLLSKPVIVSDAGGMPEMVTDEESGLVVKANDVSALRNALDRLLADRALRERLGAAARERAVTQFSVAKMIERTEAMYRRVGSPRGLG